MCFVLLYVRQVRFGYLGGRNNTNMFNRCIEGKHRKKFKVDHKKVSNKDKTEMVHYGYHYYNKYIGSRALSSKLDQKVKLCRNSAAI